MRIIKDYIRIRMIRMIVGLSRLNLIRQFGLESGQEIKLYCTAQ